MTPETIAQIAAANAEEVQRVQEAAKPGLLTQVGDTATQIDTGSQIIGLVGEAGGLVLDGLRATGQCVGAVCDLFSSLD